MYFNEYFQIETIFAGFTAAAKHRLHLFGVKEIDHFYQRQKEEGHHWIGEPSSTEIIKLQCQTALDNIGREDRIVSEINQQLRNFLKQRSHPNIHFYSKEEAFVINKGEFKYPVKHFSAWCIYYLIRFQKSEETSFELLRRLLNSISDDYCATLAKDFPQPHHSFLNKVLNRHGLLSKSPFLILQLKLSIFLLDARLFITTMLHLDLPCSAVISLMNDCIQSWKYPPFCQCPLCQWYLKQFHTFKNDYTSRYAYWRYHSHLDLAHNTAHMTSSVPCYSKQQR